VFFVLVIPSSPLLFGRFTTYAPPDFCAIKLTIRFGGQSVPVGNPQEASELSVSPVRCRRSAAAEKTWKFVRAGISDTVSAYIGVLMLAKIAASIGKKVAMHCGLLIAAAGSASYWSAAESSGVAPQVPANMKSYFVFGQTGVFLITFAMALFIPITKKRALETRRIQDERRNAKMDTAGSPGQ
jgi:hypothetical protein